MPEMLESKGVWKEGTIAVRLRITVEKAEMTVKTEETSILGCRLKCICAVFAITGALMVAGCAGAIPPIDDPDTPEPGQSNRGYNNPKDTVFGTDGTKMDVLGLFEGGTKKSSGGGGGIGVNNYLWRASLDTISFLPLSSADPFGGVIITDWYTPPETPAERFKINIYILGRQLRADGVRVAVFRQSRAGNGWFDASVSKVTAVNLENEILNRARQPRFAARTDTE